MATSRMSVGPKIENAAALIDHLRDAMGPVGGSRMSGIGKTSRSARRLRNTENVPNIVIMAIGASSAFNRSADMTQNCGAKPVHLPVEKLRKSDGYLGPGIHSNHGAEIRTTTGCHGRLPRGFESEGNPLFFRCLNLKKLLAGAAGFEPAHAGTKNRCLTAWLRPSKCGAV